MSLYAASVPVFQQYLTQAAGWLDKGDPAARLADSFPAGQQIAVAAGFSLRVSYPLAGRAVPEFDVPGERALVLASIRHAQAALDRLDPQEFQGAETRMIRHVAGLAKLEQPGTAFLTLYGLPNFFFHLTMGYAAMRAAGAVIGKSDFDALHQYPAGFHF